MLQIRRLRDGRMFDGFVQHFEGFWSTGILLEQVA